MREIKFRAWDRNTEAPRSVARIDWSIGFDGHPAIYFVDKGWVTHSSDYILEQFTGLHDKNGREIYEGDIIRSKNFSASVVNYDETCAMFRVGDIGFIDVESLHHDNEWEYIGNIHENHELLGDK